MARSDGVAFYLLTLDSLIAASDDDFVTARDAPSLAGTGITDGVGNQGTANTAQTMGQAGTASDQLSVPRAIQGGRQQ